MGYEIRSHRLNSCVQLWKLVSKYHLTISYKILTLLDMRSICLGEKRLSLGHLSFTENNLPQCNSNFCYVQSLLHCYGFSPEQYLLFLAPLDVSIVFLKIVFSLHMQFCASLLLIASLKCMLWIFSPKAYHELFKMEHALIPVTS